MAKITPMRVCGRRSRHAHSFTLIELLVVMAIIAILVGLVIMAGSGAITRAKRARAQAEIQAMSAAMDSYKVDNGIYPSSDGQLTTNSTYATYDGTMINYITNSQLIYRALSGKTNFLDAPVPGVKAYMNFTITQVGNNADPAGDNSAASSYVRDPWTYAYGYSTGTGTGGPTTNFPYNGNNFFDLWSTGGLLVAKVNTNAWISNWQ